MSCLTISLAVFFEPTFSGKVDESKNKRMGPPRTKTVLPGGQTITEAERKPTEWEMFANPDPTRGRSPRHAQNSHSLTSQNLIKAPAEALKHRFSKEDE